MELKKWKAAIESVLFASGEPLEAEKIAEALELDKNTVLNIIEDLSARLDETESGLCILSLNGRYQMCTRLEFAPHVRSVLEIKRNTPLSQAAFEVLAVVAYNQPITKAFVEQVRGVDCSSVISSLVQKGLLEEKGRMDLPGRPLLYGTTPDFLRCFCIASLEDLPPLPEKETLRPELTDNTDKLLEDDK